MRNKRDWRRYEKAYKLRQEGKVYRVIGQEFGVVPTRARQMVKKWERQLKRKEFLEKNPQLHAWEALPKRGQNEVEGELGIKGEDFNKFLETFDEADSLINSVGVRTRNEIRKILERIKAHQPLDLS